MIMVKIIADSACDLSKELLEKYNVDVIPLHIHLDELEFEDGKNIQPDDIYKWADENKKTPKTSVPSITEVMETFEKYPEDEIVCFAISQEMSSSANVMRLAAEELEAEERIHVINSKNLSTGIGALIIEASIMSKNGKTADEIVKYIESMIPKMRASFVVDTLSYLHRGGRCSGIAAISGSVLSIHPKIVVSDGKMIPTKKYRGRINKVILNYVKDMELELKEAKADRVFVTHSGCDENVVNEVYQYLKSLDHFKEILVTRAGGVISSHCGPGTLGVLYMEL